MNYFDAYTFEKLALAALGDTSTITTLSGSIALHDTTEHFLTLLSATYGSIFMAYLNFDLVGAQVDACFLYDATGGYTDQTQACRDLTTNDCPIVPAGGAGVGDRIYFGLSLAAWHQLDVYMEGGVANVDNTLVWKGWTGAAWVNLTVTDGTALGGFALGKSGRVTWTEALALKDVNGTSLFWICAEVTCAGASLPALTRAQGVYDATATGFDSNAAFLSTLEVKLYRKLGGVWQVLPFDVAHYTQCILDRNPDISGVEAYGDIRVGLRLTAAPTRNITVPYEGYVKTIKS
jgi:hypothetical protein